MILQFLIKLRLGNLPCFCENPEMLKNGTCFRERFLQACKPKSDFKGCSFPEACVLVLQESDAAITRVPFFLEGFQAMVRRDSCMCAHRVHHFISPATKGLNLGHLLGFPALFFPGRGFIS